VATSATTPSFWWTRRLAAVYSIFMSTGPEHAPAARLLRKPHEDSDPVLSWLTGPEARRHANHWVALSRESGTFLGRADDYPDLRRWQARDAFIVFVDPIPRVPRA
jgi:hypothetical protein